MTCMNDAIAQRAKSRSDFFPKLPPEVLSIGSSEVAYTFNPRVLPYKFMSFPDLRSALSDYYGLRPIDLTRQGDGLRSDDAQLSDDIGSLILASDRPDLAFRDGLLRIGEQAIRIHELRFTRENVFCKLYGTSAAGDQIIYEVLPLLWALAKVRKLWTEIEGDNQQVRYGTGTLVQLPDAGLGLLSGAFVELLRSWSSQDSLACQMGAMDVINREFRPPLQARSRFAIDDIFFVFTRDALAGSPEETRFRIGVDVTSHRGTGVYTISSELSLPQHIELVQSLLNVLQAPPVST